MSFTKLRQSAQLNLNYKTSTWSSTFYHQENAISFYKTIQRPKQHLLPCLMPTQSCAAQIQRCRGTVRIQRYRNMLILAIASIHTTS